MTPAEFAALPIGSSVHDGAVGTAGVGVVFEKMIDWCTIKWSAPKAGSISAVDYDDPQISRWTSP